MNIKQIKWQAVVSAAIVVTVIAVLFALATVTSNADTSYDPQTRTYTMTGGEYADQIILKPDTTTTINISGENRLTYADSFSGACIAGLGDLTIIGDGTLETTGYVRCRNFTMGNGTKLIIDEGMNISGTVKVEDADIESKSGCLKCSPNYYPNYYDSSLRIVFNNARLKLGMALSGKAILKDCDVILEDTKLTSTSGELTIDGGTYNITQDPTDQYPPMALDIGLRAKIQNAVIKTNAHCLIQNLEMLNSTFECTIPPKSGGSTYRAPAFWGDNIVISGSKVNIDGAGLAGIYASQMLMITNSTEADITGTDYGIVGKDVRITHSSGKFQATGPQAYAAVAAVEMPNGPDALVIPGTLSLNAVVIKEPAGGKADTVYVKPIPGEEEFSQMPTITTGKDPAKVVVLEVSHNWDAGEMTKQPTASSEGIRTHTCTICGAIKTGAIPKLASQSKQRALALAHSLKAPKLKCKRKKAKNKLFWNKITGASGYELYIKYPNSKKYVKALTKSANIKSVTHKGLSRKKKYMYKVRAFAVVDGTYYYGPFSKAKKVKVK